MSALKAYFDAVESATSLTVRSSEESRGRLFPGIEYTVADESQDEIDDSWQLQLDVHTSVTQAPAVKAAIRGLCAHGVVVHGNQPLTIHFEGAQSAQAAEVGAVLQQIMIRVSAPRGTWDHA